MSLTPSLEVMLIIFLLVAVISDLADHRIPNVLTLGAALLGIFSHLYLGGTQGAAVALGGFALGLTFLLPFYLLGGMGAGDVKMMGAVGAFVGPQAALLAVGVALVCGALGAVGLLMFGALGVHGSSASNGLDRERHGGAAIASEATHRAAGRSVKARFPYAPAIAAGALAALVYLKV